MYIYIFTSALVPDLLPRDLYFHLPAREKKESIYHTYVHRHIYPGSENSRDKVLASGLPQRCSFCLAN